MIDFNADEVTAIGGSLVRIGVFFRLAVEPDPVRVWLGIGAIEVGANAYDDAAATYQGLGELHNVPALTMLINGTAERVTFSASGVSTRVTSLASIEADSVKGAECCVGFCIFGADWRQLGVPKWNWRGRADFVTLNRTPNKERGGAISSIELSVGSLYTGRRRRGLSFLTDYDQQLRHPGDLFCERTALYSNEVTKNWPIFDPTP